MMTISRRAFALSVLSGAAFMIPGNSASEESDAAVTEAVVKYNNKYYWLSYQDPEDIQAMQEVTAEEADALSSKEVLLEDGTPLIISIGIFTVAPGSPQAQAIDRAIAAGVKAVPDAQP